MFGMGYFQKIKKRTAIIITLTLFVLLGLSMWLYVKNNNKGIMALVIILSFLFILSMNMTVTKLVVFKPRKRKYNKGYYEAIGYFDTISKLKEQGFIENKRSYGVSLSKVEGKTAYKVLLVDSYEKYFNHDENKENDSKPTPGIKKCNKFVGFEIFFTTNEDLENKVPDFSFNGDNVFYEGYLTDLETNTLVEVNKIDPKLHLDGYNHLKELLGLVEKNNPYADLNKKSKK